jgi:hypothetical protein
MKNISTMHNNICQMKILFSKNVSIRRGSSEEKFLTKESGQVLSSLYRRWAVF